MARESKPRSLAFLLAQVGAHASTRFGARLSEIGLTGPQAGILGLITGNPRISQQQLAQLLGMLPSRVVALVDEMEEAGLIRRQRDEVDRRRNTLVLTAPGRAALQKVSGLSRAHEDDLSAALSVTERKQLTALLERIAEQQGFPPGLHPGYKELRPSTTRR